MLECIVSGLQVVDDPAGGVICIRISLPPARDDVPAAVEAAAKVVNVHVDQIALSRCRASVEGLGQLLRGGRQVFNELLLGRGE